MVQSTFTLITNRDGVVEAANRRGCWRGKLVPLDPRAGWDSWATSSRDLPVMMPAVAELVTDGSGKLRECVVHLRRIRACACATDAPVRAARYLAGALGIKRGVVDTVLDREQ